jgi:septum formation protein
MAPSHSSAAKLILASQSPRRSALLQQLGVAHTVLQTPADEDAEALEAARLGEPPLVYVQRVTQAKLAAAQLRVKRLGWPAAPLLCADTTVYLGGEILGKPEDEAQALAFLRRLQGGVHEVATAVALAWPTPCPGAEPWAEAAGLSVSRVHMGPVDEAELQAYVASGDCFGKAGAYAIQGRAGAWVERIEGSYSGIMGLPLYETRALLRQAGVFPIP